jgi:hypothetical protein
MPELVAPRGQSGPRETRGDVFDALVIRASAVPDIANLRDFSPGHAGHLKVEVHNELADLFRQRLACFSGPALLPRGEQTGHPVAFKGIGFASQRALGDIDFFGSLPGGFVEQDEGADLLIQFLLRPEGPLLDRSPLIRSFSAMAFRPRHLPCLSLKRRSLPAYLTLFVLARIREDSSPFGHPRFASLDSPTA